MPDVLERGSLHGSPYEVPKGWCVMEGESGETTNGSRVETKVVWTLISLATDEVISCPSCRRCGVCTLRADESLSCSHCFTLSSTGLPPQPCCTTLRVSLPPSMGRQERETTVPKTCNRGLHAGELLQSVARYALYARSANSVNRCTRPAESSGVAFSMTTNRRRRLLLESWA